MKICCSACSPRVVIFYHGNGSTGKTTVLSKLIELLRGDSQLLVERKSNIHSVDRGAIVLYKNVLVGVGTAGDSDGNIKKNLVWFWSNGVSVAVVASRQPSGFYNTNQRVMSILGKAIAIDIPSVGNSSDASRVTCLIKVIDRAVAKAKGSIHATQSNPMKFAIW